MNTFVPKELNFSRKILCSFLGHKMIKTRNVTNHFKEYQCSFCGLELTNDIHGHKIFLTQELKEINEILNRLYQKRNYSV
jgi:hypothetical protein